MTASDATDLRVWQWLRALTPLMEDHTIAVLGNLTAEQTTFISAITTFADAKKASLTLLPDADRSTPLPTEFRTLAIQSTDSAWLAEIAETLKNTFPNAEQQWLTQGAQFPFTVTSRRPYMGENSTLIVGTASAITWPTLGVIIPTVVNAGGAMLAAVNALKTYPGPCRIAIVTNNSSVENIARLQDFADTSYGHVQVLETPATSYASAANRGMEMLNTELTLINADDTVVGPTTLIEMVRTLRETEKLNMNPGIVGPMLCNSTGDQQIDLASYNTVAEMSDAALAHYSTKSGSANQTMDLRGDLLLITAACRNAVGGFDPKFALGYYETEDYVLRARLSGFTTWIAEGAYAHHTGVATFAQPDIARQRNEEIFRWKWDLVQVSDKNNLTAAPEGVSLLIPFNATYQPEFAVNYEGIELDLYSQLSDVEFVAWVMQRMANRPRDYRRQVAALFLPANKPHYAVVEHAEIESSVDLAA